MPVAHTPEYTRVRDTLLLQEISAWRRSAKRKPFRTSKCYLEVAFILGDHTAIEVKAKENVSANDLRSLRAIAEENKLNRCLCVSLEPRTRRMGGITILPYREFLEQLWGGRFG